MSVQTDNGSLLETKTMLEMQRYFGSDFKRIAHAISVAAYANEIAKNEDCNMLVVMLASFLHDIGIHEAEKKYNSTAPKYQEKEGPPIAKTILTKLGVDSTVINEVCDMIGHHHHPRPNETTNFKILYDADRITNLSERQSVKPIASSKLNKIIEKSFLTKTGKEVANYVLCQQ